MFFFLLSFLRDTERPEKREKPTEREREIVRGRDRI